MSGVNHTLSEKPIPNREELVKRVISAFGKPTRMNSSELIWQGAFLGRGFRR